VCALQDFAWGLFFVDILLFYLSNIKSRVKRRGKRRNRILKKVWESPFSSKVTQHSKTLGVPA